MRQAQRWERLLTSSLHTTGSIPVSSGSSTEGSTAGIFRAPQAGSGAGAASTSMVPTSNPGLDMRSSPPTWRRAAARTSSAKAGVGLLGGECGSRSRHERAGVPTPAVGPFGNIACLPFRVDLREGVAAKALTKPGSAPSAPLGMDEGPGSVLASFLRRGLSRLWSPTRGRVGVRRWRG
jgi:hypothetical protein